MKKMLKFLLIGLTGMFLLSGCAPKAERYLAQYHYLPNQSTKEYKMVGIDVQIPINYSLIPSFKGVGVGLETAIYELAKWGKKTDYGYMKLVYPKGFKKELISSADDFLKAINAYGKINSRFKTGKDYLFYMATAKFYKTQPLNELVVPVNDVLEKFEKYKLPDDWHWKKTEVLVFR